MNNLNAGQLSGTLSLAQLPGGVVTNFETGVTLTNLNVGGSLNLPLPASIYAGGIPLLYASGNGSDNFFAGPAGNLTTSGYYNTAIGSGALQANVSGNYNVAIGTGALDYNETGSDNTACGMSALGELGIFAAGGVNNIALGSEAGLNFQRNESSNIDIGNAGVAGDNNIIRIGSSQTNAFIAGNVGIGTVNPPQRLLQVGDSSVPGSQGMIRLGSKTPNGGGEERSWDIGVPQTGNNGSGMGYSFVIVDATRGTNAQFLVQYGTGNVGIGTNNPTHLLQVANAYCDGNTWSPASDRNLKSGFAPLDARAVLAKVAALPITRWHYNNDETTPHVGPMAQDFYSAFGVGADDRHISDVDEGGVALAAIQGLNQKLNEKDAEIQTLKQSVAELKAMVEKLAGK